MKKEFSGNALSLQLFGYNLSVSSYVEAEDTRPQTDIRELNARIERIVENENRLRTEINAIIKELEGQTI